MNKKSRGWIWGCKVRCLVHISPNINDKKKMSFFVFCPFMALISCIVKIDPIPTLRFSFLLFWSYLLPQIHYSLLFQGEKWFLKSLVWHFWSYFNMLPYKEIMGIVNQALLYDVLDKTIWHMQKLKPINRF